MNWQQGESAGMDYPQTAKVEEEPILTRLARLEKAIAEVGGAVEKTREEHGNRINRVERTLGL